MESEGDKVIFIRPRRDGPDFDRVVVRARGEVIARIVVAVDPQPVGGGPEPSGVKACAPTVVVDQMLPAQVERPYGERGVAVRAFWLEPAGVDEQGVLTADRPPQRAPGAPADANEGACRRPVAHRLTTEDFSKPMAQDGEHRAAFLLPAGPFADMKKQ